MVSLEPIDGTLVSLTLRVFPLQRSQRMTPFAFILLLGFLFFLLFFCSTGNQNPLFLRMWVLLYYKGRVASSGTSMFFFGCKQSLVTEEISWFPLPFYEVPKGRVISLSLSFPPSVRMIKCRTSLSPFLPFSFSKPSPLFRQKRPARACLSFSRNALLSPLFSPPSSPVVVFLFSFFLPPTESSPFFPVRACGDRTPLFFPMAGKRDFHLPSTTI